MAFYELELSQVAVKYCGLGQSRAARMELIQLHNGEIIIMRCHDSRLRREEVSAPRWRISDFQSIYAGNFFNKIINSGRDFLPATLVSLWRTLTKTDFKLHPATTNRETQARIFSGKQVYSDAVSVGHLKLFITHAVS